MIVSLNAHSKYLREKCTREVVRTESLPQHCSENLCTYVCTPPQYILKSYYTNTHACIDAPSLATKLMRPVCTGHTFISDSLHVLRTGPLNKVATWERSRT